MFGCCENIRKMEEDFFWKSHFASSIFSPSAESAPISSFSILSNKNKLCSKTCSSKNMTGKRYKGSHPEEKSGQGVTDPTPKKIISGEKEMA